MSNKKKKEYKGRYSYLNDFKLNEANEYQYYGNVFRCINKEEERNGILKSVLIFLVVDAAMILLAGCVPFAGMVGAVYVFIPFVLEIVFLGLLIYAYSLIRPQTDLREYVYNKSVKRVQFYGGALMGNHIFAFVTALIYIMIKGADPLLYSALYLLSKVVSFFCTKEAVQRLLRLEYKQIQFKEPAGE